jgi:short-subunit dehydrogenase
MGKRKNELKGHCAIVTGASGGIGFEFCHDLASRGCDLLMTDINPRALETAARAISKSFPDVTIYLLTADLTSDDSVSRLEQCCRETGAEPDILINNAGIFSFCTVSGTPAAKLKCFIDLHMRAVTMLSQWFVKRREPFGSGYLLNMSSMSCWMPMPGLAMYASTKAYIRVFSRALHYEMRDSGVSVTVACPGGIATDLFGLPEHLKRLAVRLGVLDTPERFAHKAVGQMLKRRKQYINGWLNRCSIFFVGITPTPVRMMVKHKLLDPLMAKSERDVRQVKVQTDNI